MMIYELFEDSLNNIVLYLDDKDFVTFVDRITKLFNNYRTMKPLNGIYYLSELKRNKYVIARIIYDKEKWRPGYIPKSCTELELHRNIINFNIDDCPQVTKLNLGFNYRDIKTICALPERISNKTYLKLDVIANVILFPLLRFDIKNANMKDKVYNKTNTINILNSFNERHDVVIYGFDKKNEADQIINEIMDESYTYFSDRSIVQISMRELWLLAQVSSSEYLTNPDNQIKILSGLYFIFKRCIQYTNFVIKLLLEKYSECENIQKYNIMCEIEKLKR